ncbi:hypothetical protein HOLleu_09896 [Holothuria leucospilota]|uniref:Ig-like domain-containing protein n=1 Tax=Holothuria leucospilota TaxID=206669 RepID=A0A9Q1HFB2_HOLLE|nr:hypothetical protein HOLleu_09896 [Holothuria leucospilota]
MKGSHTPSVVFLLILLTYSAESTMGQDSPNVTNIDDSEMQVMRRVAGDSVRFDCNVSNIHQAIWRRDEPLKLLFAGLNPTGNDNGNIHISKENYSLILDRVDQEDEGNYTCIEYGNNTKAQYQLLVTEFSPCTEEGRNYCEDCCTPDVIQKDLKKIEETEVNEDNVDQVADELQQVSSHIEHVDPDELKSIVHSLTNIVHTTTSEEKVTEVTDSVLNIASNIMEVENKVTDQVSDVGNVPHLLEQQAATIHSKQKNYSQVLDNVGFSAVQISQSALKKDVTFESFSDDNSLKHENPPLSKNNTGLHYDKPSSNVVSAITLPSSILEIIDNAASNTTTVPLSFLVYRDASIFPVKESSNQSNESRTVISSHVISATVAIENVEIKDLPHDSQVGTTFYSFPISRSEEEVEEKRECVFLEI